MKIAYWASSSVVQLWGPLENKMVTLPPCTELILADRGVAHVPVVRDCVFVVGDAFTVEDR